MFVGEQHRLFFDRLQPSAYVLPSNRKTRAVDDKPTTRARSGNVTSRLATPASVIQRDSGDCDRCDGPVVVYSTINTVVLYRPPTWPIPEPWTTSSAWRWPSHSSHFVVSLMSVWSVALPRVQAHLAKPLTRTHLRSLQRLRLLSQSKFSMKRKVLK